MFGVLTIAVRVYHDRRGYGVYSGPIGTAILIIAAKWVRAAGPSAPRALSLTGALPARSLRWPPGRGRLAGHSLSGNTKKMTIGRTGARIRVVSGP